MLCRLNGISLVDMPYLSKGDEVIILREEGELWDSEARPAYSVRINTMHLGYIPLVETISEEALKARDGWLKVWKEGYEELTKEELRKIAQDLNDKGELGNMHEWAFVGTENSKHVWKRKDQERENTIIVRDWLYTEIMQNHLTPQGTLHPVWYDKEHGRNTVEIGDVCSVSVNLPEIW